MMIKVLRQIYTRIQAEAAGLRAEVTANCIKRWREFRGHGKLQVITDVVEKLEPFGLQVGLSLKEML